LDGFDEECDTPRFSVHYGYLLHEVEHADNVFPERDSRAHGGLQELCYGTISFSRPLDGDLVLMPTAEQFLLDDPESVVPPPEALGYELQNTGPIQNENDNENGQSSTVKTPG